MEVDDKLFNVGLLIVATLVVAKLISALIMPRSGKRLPPVVKTWPVLGGLVRFLKGPVVMLREEYPKLGSVFTLNLLNKNITFFIGPEVSAHFFKAPESDLSQQEVYQFNVPTFGPGVVFDVDYTVRQEQFRFFTEALRVNKLKGYVDQMVAEAESPGILLKMGESGEVDLKYELEHLIILTASRCLLGVEVRNKLFDDVSALFHDLDSGMLPISVIFPYLPIPAHRRRDQARKKLADIFAKIIAAQSEVTGLLIAALFAGQHTSSITSTWTGAYLLSNKNYLSAVLDEQKNLVKKHGNNVDHDILSEMEVLHRHGCLGEPFAYLQIKAIWGHLLRNFELELISPFPEIDWNAMVVGVKGKVMVRYKRRELSIN
ncbi:similar to CYTOCHROME P450 51G1 [Actinidia rufa]|uniref:Similar to CYTOCHROME P450 51G1 n=1 Tax=Actinidia rufa TaxID=165716 RepID=A0A7J0HD62_9ERIC|nr:similar to CYTOCHROME P450 51G1 [Actinidia rufa]